MNEAIRSSNNISEKFNKVMEGKGMNNYRYVEDLRRRIEAGDAGAEEKYEKIMECLNSMDDDRVANCIILMKQYIPQLWNQSALLLKKYIVDKDRSLENLSRDEVELIEFMREYLKE